MSPRSRGWAAPRLLFGLSVLLAVPWIWTTARATTRGSAIAWLALTAAIGVLWVVAGVRCAATGSSTRARWGGGLSVLAGLGMVALAVAMLPIAYESTWAV